MGRGRQKAKQQKIARKLKYLTTDTDYDELAKELNAQEPGSGSFDPIADAESQYEREHGYTDTYDHDSEYDKYAENGQTVDDSDEDQLDEYAKWAAESAAKATQHESNAPAKPVAHKPIPMPVPGSWKPRSASKTDE